MPSEGRVDSLREIWLVLHRWLGLGVLVFFAIASATGAVLVYEHELDTWINRDVFPVTQGDVGAAKVLAGADRAGSGEFSALRWPHARDPVYTVESRTSDGLRTLRFDPGSGELVAPVRSSNRLLRIIRRTHTTLLVGTPGRYLVLTASVLALVSMITGLILWWPGIRRFGRGFGVRVRRGLYPFTFDAHQVVGAIVLPLLFIITLTGILIPYQSVVERALGLVLREDISDASPAGLTSSPGRLPPLAYIEAGERAVPDGSPTVLRMPARDGQPVRIELMRGPRGRAGTIVTVALDAGSAAILSVRDPRNLGTAARIAGPLNFNVHIGAVGGPWVRVLYVIVCLIGVALAVTGFMIWWMKRTLIGNRAKARTSLEKTRAGV
jgi:uncharacterized iron-regulated membrane protein